MARTATLPEPIPAVDVGRDGRTGAGVDDASEGGSAWPFGWSEEQYLGGYGSRCPRNELPMHSLLTRHAVQQLIRAGRTQAEVSAFCGVSERSVRRIAKEEPVQHPDDNTEHRQRKIGRPSKTEPFRDFVKQLLTDEPDLMSLEILRRARLRGYDGAKSALYELVASERSEPSKFHMRFEGLPGEFSQHDFGEVDVRFIDGHRRRVHFFASRLKWSRWAEVSLVDDQTAETLVRNTLDHFVAFGGVPLCAVFDRPKTVALKWGRDGKITEWNPTFAYAAMEIGFTAEVCWAYQPQQKGAVEAIVKWVKNSFFKQRRFHDMDDLRTQLREWLDQVNGDRPSRATGVPPATRLLEEQARLRPPRVAPDELALRVPITVGPTAQVTHDLHAYSMPPTACGIPGTLYLYRDRVRIVAGRHEAVHPRKFGSREDSMLPQHRAEQLAAVSGARGKRYFKRQQVFATGEAAVLFLTEIVHRDPKGWWREVDDLFDLLQRFGPEPMNRALRAAVDTGRFDVDLVAQLLAARAQPSLQLVQGTRHE
jgi:transposase